MVLALALLRPSREIDPESDAQRRLSRLSPPESLVSVLRRRVEWIEDRVIRLMMEENQTPALRKQGQETMRLNERFEETGEKLFQAASERTSPSALPGMISFRAAQSLTYIVLLILLFFALGDAAAWGRFLGAPGVGSALGLASSFVRSLFSSKGLAALLSYALLNLFFGVRFLLSFRKKQDTATDKAVASLADAIPP